MINVQGQLYPSVKDMCDFLTNCNYSLDDLYFKGGIISTPIELPASYYYYTIGVFKKSEDKKPLIIFDNSDQCIFILDDILVSIIEEAYEKTIIHEVKWDYKAAMDYGFDLFAIDELEPYRRKLVYIQLGSMFESEHK